MTGRQEVGSKKMISSGQAGGQRFRHRHQSLAFITFPSTSSINPSIYDSSLFQSQEVGVSGRGSLPTKGLGLGTRRTELRSSLSWKLPATSELRTTSGSRMISVLPSKQLANPTKILIPSLHNPNTRTILRGSPTATPTTSTTPRHNTPLSSSDAKLRLSPYFTPYIINRTTEGFSAPSPSSKQIGRTERGGIAIPSLAYSRKGTLKAKKCEENAYKGMAVGQIINKEVQPVPESTPPEPLTGIKSFTRPPFTTSNGDRTPNVMRTVTGSIGGALLAATERVHVNRSQEERDLSPDAIRLDGKGLKRFPVIGGGEGPSLKLLSLQHNIISRLDAVPLQLSHLVVLDLYDNRLDRISGLLGLVSLRVLLLGKNRIRRIEGLEGLKRLEILDLHGNQLRYVNNVGSLNCLRVMNLAGNMLRSIRNLGPFGLSSLTELNLKRNRIRNLEGLTKAPHLRKLLLANNELQSFGSLVPLRKLLFLQELLIEPNPVTLLPEYRNQVISLFPWLITLDRVVLTEGMRLEAKSWLKARQTLEEERRKEEVRLRMASTGAIKGIKGGSREHAIYHARRRWESLKKFVKNPSGNKTDPDDAGASLSSAEGEEIGNGNMNTMKLNLNEEEENGEGVLLQDTFSWTREGGELKVGDLSLGDHLGNSSQVTEVSFPMLEELRETKISKPKMDRMINSTEEMGNECWLSKDSQMPISRSDCQRSQVVLDEVTVDIQVDSAHGREKTTRIAVVRPLPRDASHNNCQEKLLPSTYDARFVQIVNVLSEEFGPILTRVPSTSGALRFFQDHGHCRANNSNDELATTDDENSNAEKSDPEKPAAVIHVPERLSQCIGSDLVNPPDLAVETSISAESNSASGISSRRSNPLRKYPFKRSASTLGLASVVSASDSNFQDQSPLSASSSLYHTTNLKEGRSIPINNPLSPSPVLGSVRIESFDVKKCQWPPQSQDSIDSYFDDDDEVDNDHGNDDDEDTSSCTTTGNTSSITTRSPRSYADRLRATKLSSRRSILFANTNIRSHRLNKFYLNPRTMRKSLRCTGQYRDEESKKSN